MQKTNRIVLIGFRGAGKTTIGKQLSDRLAWRCISTDEMIESQVGMKISELVNQSGWPSFRQMETAALRSVGNENNVIIDCGGGVVEDAENMALLKNGLVVWVDADLADIFHRLKSSGDRPLLNQADLLDDIKTNYHRRAPLYRQYSRFYVNTSQDTVDSICRRIIEIL